MQAVLAVMSTTELVVETRPKEKKNSGPYGI